MDYHEIIAKAKIQQEEAKQARDAAEEERKRELRALIAVARARFDTFVIEELSAAQAALETAGIIAEQGNGNLPHGIRRSLRIEGKALAFIGLFTEQSIRPELHYRIEHTGSIPADPLSGTTRIGIGENFTRAQVQEVIAAFLSSAMNL
jgi:multidrug efflux pump subunit AcrA (membrane-fusion protein)